VERQQRFGVSYAKVWRRPMRFEIRSVGTLEPDAGRVFEYVTHGDCYIQSLNVSSPGERVSSGQALLTIYSPNLRGAEQGLVSLLTVQNAGTVRQGSLNQLVFRRSQFPLPHSHTCLVEVDPGDSEDRFGPDCALSLNEGDRVVSSGNSLIDSESQIAGAINLRS
jgi:hypothetical protein